MQQAAAHLSDTLDNALPLLKAITDEQATEKPAPGKWSYKEIIGHLVDSAANNHQKFLRTAAEDGVRFPPYEQNYWVASQHYNKRNWQELLLLWEQYNRHLAHIMQHIPEASLQNSIYIGEKGPFTLGFITTDYTEHLKHHLKAILPQADFLQSSFRMVY